jgi:hypothetical protein
MDFHEPYGGASAYNSKRPIPRGFEPNPCCIANCSGRYNIIKGVALCAPTHRINANKF